MAISKESYFITSTNIEELVTSMNFILSRISDRLDKIEGLRGNSTVSNSLDILGSDENIVHGFNTDD